MPEIKNFASTAEWSLAADQFVRAGCRYHMLRTFSTEAAAALPAVDFVFIDGLHTYEGVVADIDAYYPKMAAGGVMIFNDYGSAHYPGVTRAVDEFVAREGLRLRKKWHDMILC